MPIIAQTTPADDGQVFLVVGMWLISFPDSHFRRAWPVSLRFDLGEAENVRKLCVTQAAAYHDRFRGAGLVIVSPEEQAFRLAMFDPNLPPYESGDIIHYEVWTLREDPRSAEVDAELEQAQRLLSHEPTTEPSLADCPHLGVLMPAPWLDQSMGALGPGIANEPCRKLLGHEGPHDPPCSRNCARECRTLPRVCAYSCCSKSLHPGWPAVYCSTRCALADA